MDTHTEEHLLPVHYQILRVLDTGSAKTRADLARSLGVAPSTASARVQELLDWGRVTESGMVPSHGGRPATMLRTSNGPTRFLAVSLGSRHARMGVLSFSGSIEHVEEVPFDVGKDPESALESLLEPIERTISSDTAGSGIAAACIAIPGPVDAGRQTVTNAARLPGWQDFAAGTWLSSRLGVPVLVENDANLTALGEHVLHPDLSSSITVKAGTGIGAGVVIDGKVHRGATGMGGDLSHARLPGTPDIPCACGNTGCLESVASGQALVRQMQATGRQVENLGDIVKLVLRGEPESTLAVREAGRTVGMMLCPIVEFINPQALFLGGQLSSLEVFVAAVRGQLYDGCHPLVTMELVIEPASAGPDAALIGAAHLLVDHQFNVLTS